MSLPLLTMVIRFEEDVVSVRQRARQVAAALGFDGQDQTRIATAISEIARNAFMYAGSGKAEFLVEGHRTPQLLVVRVSDSGPGIKDVDRIMSGRYQSPTGMGLGMAGARRLVDRFDVVSTPGRGTTVTLGKLFSRRAPLLTETALAALADTLVRSAPYNPIEEVRQQNQELLATLAQLLQRQEELSKLNAELEDTNRGVVALYAELDEKADTLRRADELKSRFLSNMSHEFRTPLNSVLALSRLLLEDREVSLSPSQQRQVGYIRQAAEDLTELVNDLLDLASVEAGKVVIRPTEFSVANLFAALRGMLRPLLLNESVSLVFDEPVDMPEMRTDERKVSQILRNFLSNALKFTERGEIRVSARPSADGSAVMFSVADTGIGIAPADRERIFDEFTQIDHPVQRRVRGTGLGLPLVRKLAGLLGGHVSVESELGQGSTFTATVPVVYPATPPLETVTVSAMGPADPLRPTVLLVEDNPQELLIYENYFRHSAFNVALARTVAEARRQLHLVGPVAIVLDIRLAGDDAWAFIGELRQSAPTRDLPLVVVTNIDDRAKGLALGADAYALKPVERAWLLDTLEQLISRRRVPSLLLIDDDETARYLVRAQLGGARLTVQEASGGVDGLREARLQHPTAIVLDLSMPEMSGFEVIGRLKEDPATTDIPVIVLTSKRLTEDERRQLAPHALRIVSKETLARAGQTNNLFEALTAAGIPLDHRDA